MFKLYLSALLLSFAFSGLVFSQEAARRNIFTSKETAAICKKINSTFERQIDVVCKRTVHLVHSCNEPLLTSHHAEELFKNHEVYYVEGGSVEHGTFVDKLTFTMSCKRIDQFQTVVIK